MLLLSFYVFHNFFSFFMCACVCVLCTIFIINMNALDAYSQSFYEFLVVATANIFLLVNQIFNELLTANLLLSLPLNEF